MRPGLVAMMADNAIPDHAARVGFYIATHDTGGGVELRLDDVSRLLHDFPGDDKCRTALRILAVTGYVSRAPGGRGHGDLFRWLGTDRVGMEPQPNVDYRVGPEPHPNLASGQSPTLNPDSIGLEPQPKSHVVVEVEEVVVVVEEDAREKNGLNMDVVAYLGSDACEVQGARKSFRNYFADRVDTARQWGYLSTVRSWLGGGIGAPRGLLSLADPIAVIHTALNELLQLSPNEEVLMYKASRGKVGSTDTLRSKIEYLIQRDANARPGSPGPTKPPGGSARRAPKFPDPEQSAA